MGGSSAFLRLGSMARFLDHGLQLLARMEGDNAAGADGDFLAGLRVAAGALRLVAQLEVAEARELDAFAALKRPPDLLEEGLDHVLGLALVQPDLLEKQVGQLGLRQRHRSLPRIPFSLLCTESCGESASQQADQRIAGSICFRIREGAFSILHNYPKSKAFCPCREVAAAVKAEKPDRAHDGRFLGLDGVQDLSLIHIS